MKSLIGLMLAVAGALGLCYGIELDHFVAAFSAWIVSSIVALYGLYLAAGGSDAR